MCPCGSLVTVMPGAAGSEVPCRSCQTPVAVPAPGVFMAAGVAVAPAPAAAATAAPPPRTPLPAPAPAASSLPARVEFGQDLRLDLRVLDREARQAGWLARVALWAGILGAAAVLALLTAPVLVRVLCALAVILAGCLLWGAFRAARVSALAAVALAERQRELAHRTAR